MGIKDKADLAVRYAFSALILFMFVGISGSAASERRVALVIGNSSYTAVTALKNPKNDAQDMAATLSDLGYEVVVELDTSQSEMLRALRDFQQDARTSAVAIVYFAGHGIEVEKQNYLIPTDARLQSDLDIPFETIPLDNVVFAASGASELSLVILDACRNNPFANQMAGGTRSIGRGLASVEPKLNTVVAYAAKAGTVAYDGDDRNSPYTEALLHALKTPNLEIGLFLRSVRDRVHGLTGGQQEPFWYGSLSSRKLFLNASAPVEPKQTPQAEPALAPDAPRMNLAEQEAVWNSIKDTRDPDLLSTFLEIYPDSAFAPFAKHRLNKLNQSVPTPEPELAPSPPLALDEAAQKAEPKAQQFALSDQAPKVGRDLAPIAQKSAASANQTLRLLASLPVNRYRPSAVPTGFAATTSDALPVVPTEEPLKRNELRDIQERLTILGFKPGPIDGLFGSRTRTAIKTYEQQVGLTSSGEATQSTLIRLRRAISDDDVAAFRAQQAERRKIAQQRAAARRAREQQEAAQKAAAQQAAAVKAAEQAAAKKAAERRARRNRRDDDDDDDNGSSNSGSSNDSGGGSGCSGFSC